MIKLSFYYRSMNYANFVEIFIFYHKLLFLLEVFDSCEKLKTNTSHFSLSIKCSLAFYLVYPKCSFLSPSICFFFLWWISLTSGDRISVHEKMAGIHKGNWRKKCRNGN